MPELNEWEKIVIGTIARQFYGKAGWEELTIGLEKVIRNINSRNYEAKFYYEGDCAGAPKACRKFDVLFLTPNKLDPNGEPCLFGMFVYEWERRVSELDVYTFFCDLPKEFGKLEIDVLKEV